MNKHVLMMATVATLAGIMPLAPAHAETAAGTLNVSATVVGNCKITPNTINLSFPDYDSTNTTDVDTSVPLQVFCTKGIAPTSIDLDNGGNSTGDSVRRMASDKDFLNYELYKDAAYTLNWGTGTNGLVPTPSTSIGTPLTDGGNVISVYGRIKSGQDVQPGSYTDTVNITVNY